MRAKREALVARQPARVYSFIVMPLQKMSPFLLAVLCATFLRGQTVTPSPAAPVEIVVLHDVVIGKGGDRDLHAEVAYPKTTMPLMPAVLYIHGGGWVGGNYKHAPLEALARAGFFAATIEYRLSGEAKWPAQIEDCKLGVRWMRANAQKYGVDPNRIGVWGESAGGHLVTCLVTMADEKEFEGKGGWPEVSSSVQAAVDYFGPVDFVNPKIYTPRAAQFTTGLFGVDRDKNLELWKSGSPVFYVKAGDAPMLIVHGDSDGLVPVAQSTTLDDALTKAAVPHQLVIVKNADHGFGPRPGTTIDPDTNEIHRITLEFLTKYLKP